MAGSGELWSRQAQAVVSHVRRIVELCFDQLATDGTGIPAAMRSAECWAQVERALLPAANQHLRSALGALKAEASARGLLSDGSDLGLLLQEGQAGSRELALRDRLRVESATKHMNEIGAPTKEPAKASLREISEVDLATAKVRRNPYAGRIAKEGITIQAGRGRPRRARSARR
jgi:hypothetical protein